MMEKPGLVSVILPVYNAEKTLARAIDSVLSERELPLELILIDDGSTDQSAAILDRYAAADARVAVRHVKNGGVSRARNAGLALARGEFVAFMDADDAQEAGFLRILKGAMAQDHADLALCGFRMETAEGAWRECTNGDAHCAGQEEIRFFLAAHNNVGVNQLWNKLYRRALLPDGFDEAMPFGEDTAFNLAYYPRCERLVSVGDCLYKYYYGGAGSGGNRFYENRFAVSRAQYVNTAGYLLDGARKPDLSKTGLMLVQNALQYARKMIKSGAFSPGETRARIGQMLRDDVWAAVFQNMREKDKLTRAFELIVKWRLALPLYLALKIKGD